MTYKHTAIQIFNDNLCHIFHNDDYAIIFDPAEPQVIYNALSKHLTKPFYHKNDITGLTDSRPRKLLYTFVTHHHKDHSDGNEFFLKYSKVVVNKKSSFLPHTEFLCDNYDIEELRLTIKTLHTPCHTEDSVCFYIDDKYLVSGDTIFYMGVGKFFEGTPRQMCDAIQLLKKELKLNTIILYGHDYREANLKFAQKFNDNLDLLKKKMFLSLEEEKMYNPFFRCQDNEDAMKKMRESKNIFK